MTRRYENPSWNQGPADLSDFDSLTVEDMEADEADADPIKDPDTANQLLSAAGGLEIIRALNQFPFIGHLRLSEPVTVGGLVEELRRIADVLQRTGVRHEEDENELLQLKGDIAAFRRVLGVQP